MNRGRFRLSMVVLGGALLLPFSYNAVSSKPKAADILHAIRETRVPLSSQADGRQTVRIDYRNPEAVAKFKERLGTPPHFIGLARMEKDLMICPDAYGLSISVSAHGQPLSLRREGLLYGYSAIEKCPSFGYQFDLHENALLEVKVTGDLSRVPAAVHLILAPNPQPKVSVKDLGMEAALDRELAVFWRRSAILGFTLIVIAAVWRLAELRRAETKGGDIASRH